MIHIRQHVKPHMIGQRHQSDKYGILYLKASLLQVFSSPNPVCLSAFNYGYKNLARQSSWRIILFCVQDHIHKSKNAAMFTQFLPSRGLNEILRKSGRHDEIKCPQCRRESRVPRSGNLKDLPANSRINGLLDVLAIKKCDTIGVKCGNCDNESTQSFYCFQCCSFWCAADCIILHNRMKANREHRALALKDFQNKDFENVLKRPAFC